MIKILPAVFFMIAFFSLLSAQELPCQKVVSYKIDAKLDAQEKKVYGSLVLDWKNCGSTETQELYFHLYLNAFKNTQSTFFKEVTRNRVDPADFMANFEKGGWGYCDVLSVTAASAGNFAGLPLQPIFVQPDDDNLHDETVFKLNLPTAVAPGESVTLTIQFASKLPHKAPRTGYYQDYFFVAQWFPKIGVWFSNEWNCHQFHSHSEFFADFGDYDVRLTVPSEFVIGASGVQTDSTAHENGTKTLRFQQQNIHDFAWTAFPHYKTAVRTFAHPDLPTVNMRLLYLPDHKRYVDDFFSATENTLKYLGLWYVPYPYSNITIVDAVGKSNSGGMEYPTLFTTEVDWLTARGSQEPLGLTMHECAHQFFYGIIGSNEFENAWMDEGFTTYATSRCLNTVYGAGAFSKVYLARDGFGVPVTFKSALKEQRDWIVENHQSRGDLDSMNKKSWDFVNYHAYRNNAYEKPALLLWTLENYLGENVFSVIMKTYAQRWAFKHPTPQDFMDVVNEFAPENMDWFFEKMLNEPGTVDYAVAEIVSNSPTKVQGYVGVGDAMMLKDEEVKDDVFESQVHIERRGEIQLPVEVLVTFENGETVLKEWNGVEPYKIFYFTSETKIDKVEIDPYHKIWLDVDPINNAKYRKASRLTAFRWGATWLFWLQDLLEMIAVFS